MTSYVRKQLLYVKVVYSFSLWTSSGGKRVKIILGVSFSVGGSYSSQGCLRDRHVFAAQHLIGKLLFVHWRTWNDGFGHLPDSSTYGFNMHIITSRYIHTFAQCIKQFVVYVNVLLYIFKMWRIIKQWITKTVCN